MKGEPPRFDLLGVGIHALTLPQAVTLIRQRAREPGGSYVCFAGVHPLSLALDDPAMRAILNQSWLTTPDGMPLVWWGRHCGHTVERVYGPDVLLALAEAGRDADECHAFYGAAPGVAAELAARLAARFPGLQVADVQSPPYRPATDAELDALAARWAERGVRYAWISLSTPKQDYLMARLAPRLRQGVCLGVGAAFDLHTGRVRQAPRWVQRSGLEWLFRVSQEPRRLAPRYFWHHPRFVARWLAWYLREGRTRAASSRR
jgi:N-acetylglucosaminyldiphosphoundecaprenol N-acetyl-beta-D-mannosaminyltransferase